MAKQTKKPQGKKRRRTKGSQNISINTASFAFAILLAGNDKARLERLLKLALRGPDIIKVGATLLSEHYGGNVELLMQGEPNNPATKEELIEIVKPVLEEGTKLASFAQIFDLYLLSSQPTPEDIVYIFYIIARYFISKEQEPTAEQIKQIWWITLMITQTSTIGAKHWKELENKGPVYLEDWLEKVKENARKKFKTFLNQKKRMENNAQQAFKSLFSFFFEDQEASEYSL